ncbi:P-loop containing nucleoside triphosphate hydrolase protein [Russula ochroleuca]|uniref:RNA helicase n=1 Tax=Russula ochroleuca TaxID=152965 RepID=A0A9P5JT27_9AGAM|nr:P-loop containing nucleoside triphosphate hydrolase protein [Russula ochroleuca]
MNRPERFNAKARRSGSTASSHKRGKQRRHKRQPITDADTNPEILPRKSTEEKEIDRREQLKKELLSQSQSKASSKKRKRLDKYIEKKLKKEERVELFEKLAKSQAELPSTLQLQSSSTLGAGRTFTAQERLEKTEDKDVWRAIHSRQTSGRFANIAESDEDEEVVDKTQDVHSERDTIEDGEGTSPRGQVVIINSASTASRKQDVPADVVVGSALQRNADGTIVKPRIMKKKGTSTILRKWKHAPSTTLPTSADGDSESSFDSSDSAHDTSEAETETTNSDTSERAQDNTSEAESGIPEDESSRDTDTGLSTHPRRSVGFKQWAVTQLSTVKDYVAPIQEPSSQPRPPEEDGVREPSRPNKKRKIDSSSPMEMRGPLGEDITLPSTSFAEHLKCLGPRTEMKRKVVVVTRLPEVDDARLLLPIVAEEQPIMEAILLNTVVVICGETGSGKTTQVPQFLFEAGFGSPESDNPGMIGITQPRRVAAMSMASRVAHELSLPKSRVSYQIRYDATVSPSTSIKFMTDGVLLRELGSDFLLSKYSVLIIDEAHERSMNTDILIGVVSRVVKLRESMWREGKDSIKPLRLVIMSATLRISDFVENATLFATPPPVVKVPARQYPVTVHFNRRTSSDYVSDAIRKASKIHARLPPGGILIFLTGQNEISGVCRRLEERYGAKNIAERRKRRQGTQVAHDAQRFFKNDEDNIKINPSQVGFEAEEIDLGDTPEDDLALDVDGEPSNEKDTDMDALDTDDEAEDQALGIDTEESDVPMHIIPLYSLLPTEKQMKVFEPPPAGTRLVVVATNVAETSLTIPGIRYVIDCGRAKERRYNLANGIQSFQVSWVSKASAAQRAGRAGRTGPGHCYRLYSSAVFENYFEEFSQPEILRVPIEGVVLQMKCMHIDAVANFPFPTPPDRQSLRQSEKMLVYLGALEAPPNTTPSGVAGGTVTDIGRTMFLFPLSPRFSKMLVSSRRHGCLPYAIAIVSALSVGDPFLREEALGVDEDSSGGEEEMTHISKEKVRAKETSKLRRREYFLSQQYHASLGKSTSDLFRILSVVGAYEYAGGGHSFCAEHFIRPKAMEEIHKLRAQISNIVRVNFADTDADAGFTQNCLRHETFRVLRQLITSCFVDNVASVPYRALCISEDVFIHPSSVLATTSPPDYVVYHEVVRTSQVWLKGLTLINPAWLPSLGKSLCTFSKPFKNKAGDMMVTPKFGPDGWELPAVKVDNQQ